MQYRLDLLIDLGVILVERSSSPTTAQLELPLEVLLGKFLF